MRVYLCDDTEADREILKKYFFTYANGQNLEFVISETASAKELLSIFKDSETEPTVVFLDIYMKGLSGVEAAEMLYKKGFNGTLIFTTTSKDHAMDGFRLGADGYLHKPYQYEEFAKTLERSKPKWMQSLKAITVTSERLTVRVLLKHIEAIESLDHICMIYGQGGELKTRQSLTQLAQSLLNEPGFIRCGRSHLVNLAFVVRLQDGNLLLQSGRCIPVPVKERPRVSALLSEYAWTMLRELGSKL